MRRPGSAVPDDPRDRPLAGRRIVLTRPADQAGDFVERITALGGTPVIAPAIAIAPPDDAGPLDAAIQHIEQFEWIAFTSANAARAVAGRARALGVGLERFAAVKLAAVGVATAEILARELRAPDAVARTATARSLGSELPVEGGARVLVPRADLAGDRLATVLLDRGALPHDVLAYRTVPGEGVAEIVEGLRTGTIDALLFASASAIRFVADALTPRTGDAPLPAPRAAIFCIGPSTARAAEAAGFAPAAVAAVATQHALIDAVADWFSARGAADA